MRKLLLILLLLCPLTVMAQGGGSQGGYPAYRFRRLAADPATCTTGDVYFNYVTPAYRKCLVVNTWSDFDPAVSGSITSSGYTMNTARLLGRNTASAGAIEEITLGTGLSFSGTTLNATTGIGGSTGATDNALLRADGTGGSTLQAGVNATLSDAGTVTVTTASASQLAFIDSNTALYSMILGDVSDSLAMRTSYRITWNASGNAYENVDTGLKRHAAGVVEVNNGTAGTIRDLVFRTFKGNGTGAAQLATAQTTAPTCSSNCGTSPSVVGTDTFMRVTMGASGSPASGWVVTFNGTWAAAPVCVVQMAKAGMAVGKQALTVVTTTTTITVVTNGTAPATTDVYAITCGGVQ